MTAPTDAPPGTATRLVVGCMTGTSIDALDTALVRIHGCGLRLRAEFIRGDTRPLGPLAPRLRAMAEQHPMSAADIAGLSHDFALLHAAAIAELMQSDRPDLVAVHGQTVYHAPPLSWQMFSGPVLAHLVHAPVVFDLRAADLAAGGQGAPITPLADWMLFRSDLPTAVINLGGFCNATLLPACAPTDDLALGLAAINGYDICACNHLLDTVARTLLNRPYDENGHAAQAGTPHAAATSALTDLLTRQSREGRSLGTGDELGRWIDQWRAHATPNDLAASACTAIGRAIAARLRPQNGISVLVAGGGARNIALVDAIRHATNTPVHPTDTRGVPIEQREAIEMAVLGALCQDKVPITLSRVTGVSLPPISGVWAGV